MTRASLVTNLSAFLVLSTVAFAQIDETTSGQVEELRSESEAVQSNLEGAGIFQKIEKIVGLSKRLEELSKMVDAIEDKVSKMQTTASQASAGPAMPPSQVAPVAPLLPAPQVPAAPPEPSNPTIEAERVAAESFGVVSGDENYDAETVPMPFLNDSTPDWVKNGLEKTLPLATEYSFVISSSLLPDIEQCNEDLKSRMMAEIRAYLRKNILKDEDAKLPELTKEYVEKYWVRQGQVFDNVQDRPSGTYHQVWLGLHISSDQLAKIREWEKHSERDQRTKQAGVVGGIGVFAVSLLSGAVGLLARREKAKLKR